MAMDADAVAVVAMATENMEGLQPRSVDHEEVHSMPLDVDCEEVAMVVPESLTAPQEAAASSSSPSPLSTPSPLAPTHSQQLQSNDTKQRTTAATASSSTAEECIVQPVIVHIDEQAPNLNNRFYRGITRPGQRARLREERAAARRMREQQRQQHDDINGDSNHANVSSSCLMVLWVILLVRDIWLFRIKLGVCVALAL